MSILTIAQNLAQGLLTVEQIIGFTTIALRSGGKDFTDKDVKHIVEEAGLVDTLAECGKILTTALGADSGNVEGAGSE